MVQCKTALYLRAGYLRASLLLALGLGTLSLQSQLQAEEPPANSQAVTTLASTAPAEKVVSFTMPISPPENLKKEHPIYPALQLAREAHAEINKKIVDYTCSVVRRERIQGKLRPYEFLNAKVRHELLTGQDTNNPTVETPFSVYLRFSRPASVVGREALYVAGRNAGKVFVRRGGQRMAYLSSYIKPDSRIAMKENRYTITDIGFKLLIERLIEVMEEDIKHGECKVKFFANAKVNERTCTRIEVTHPIKRDHFRFYRSIVFVDDEDKIPVAYASYYWPSTPGGRPQLLEEYIYSNIKLNVGLLDEDFDRDNRAYGFTRE